MTSPFGQAAGPEGAGGVDVRVSVTVTVLCEEADDADTGGDDTPPNDVDDKPPA